MTSKWWRPGSTRLATRPPTPFQIVPRRALWRRNSGRSAAPTQVQTRAPGRGRRRAGLSARAAGRSSPNVSFMAVASSGTRSCTPLIESVRPIRSRTPEGSATSSQSRRVTTWPPAECPASRIGPSQSSAAAATARAVQPTISASVASGHSG